jgi:hypothetical protein
MSSSINERAISMTSLTAEVSRRVAGWRPASTIVGGRRRGSAHVNRVLRHQWNPIGITMPDDEYSNYAGTVGRLLREGASTEEIAAFLASARERTGFERNKVDARADRRVATSLHGWYGREMRETE